MTREIKRCDWATKNKIEQEYHDTEWGIPVHDDKQLFKMLVLEGKQAGLSWTTILAKKETLCKAFDDFDPAVLVTYDDKKKAELLQNDGIIKNKLKINAAISNAHAYYDVCEQYGSLDNYLWSFVDNKPIINSWKSTEEVPVSTPLSDKLSKDLKKQGFKFVGSTTVYAFMQSVGMVNDHLDTCSFKNK
ncbi:DNA-3-methyladenine glycosylase I [Lactobacillus sp. M0390]|uniref:DNA-3-methyladenine glycosylase I n=1 Tax=Lactobacillus sp. M0390 TaxID=2751026 RepID=UPI0018DD0B41|nr:DNA-3-methyladenine glycosylase I [Lactobacillus sp. M0390]MBH9985026.1 DNA-3-methyladenine glycosylase I [Lactobacillus sp. M0390]